MAGEALASLLAIQTMQAVFESFHSTVKYGSFLCPLDATVEQITSIRKFNYIIVGAGTAGSVLANRLSACPHTTVLLLETGDCPPIEAIYMGLFAYIPKSKHDYDYTTVNNGYSLQNQQGNVGGLTIGKMLGGTSCLHHGLHVRGDQVSYDKWNNLSNGTWNFDSMLPYFKKNEDVEDRPIIKKYKPYHGTSGNVVVKRQISTENRGIFEAFDQLGYKVRIDTNNDDPLGITEPLLENDRFRQCGLVSYISPVKNRPNLYVLTNATVTKVIIDRKKVAIGVNFTYKGSSYVVNSINEVIGSAGAIKTPQLLMISGVGPIDHLKSKNIPVVVNLPVGENLQDHSSAVILFTLGRDSSPTSAPNPTKFPAPITCNYANLDNKTADFAQCQGINLVIPHNNPGLMALCLNAFKYKIPICQDWYNANVGRKVMFSYNTLYNPLSRGSIKLNTTNINDQPLVEVGYLKNKNDVKNFAKCLANTAKVLETDYFKKVGARFLDLGLCLQHKKYSAKYWECYGLAMSTTSWHFCGTAAMGSVVDYRFRVYGIKGLRVVDASAIPIIPNAKLIAAVYAVAERAADMILSDHKICQNTQTKQN